MVTHSISHGHGFSWMISVTSMRAGCILQPQGPTGETSPAKLRATGMTPATDVPTKKAATTVECHDGMMKTRN